MSSAGEKFIPAFHPADTVQAGMIRGALEESGIPCYVDNENASAVRYGGMGIGVAQMTVLVSESRKDEALQIIRDLGFE